MRGYLMHQSVSLHIVNEIPTDSGKGSTLYSNISAKSLIHCCQSVENYSMTILTFSVPHLI